MAEIDDLKMILRNADVSCITDAKTYAEQKIRFGECIIFVSSLERREAKIRDSVITDFLQFVCDNASNEEYANEDGWAMSDLIDLEFKYLEQLKERK